MQILNLLYLKNQLYLYHHGENDSQIYYNVSNNGNTWRGNQPISDSSNTPILRFDVVVYNDVLYLITTNDRGGLTIKSSTDGINFRDFSTISGGNDEIFSSFFIDITELQGRFYILLDQGSEMSITSTSDFRSFTNPEKIQVNGTTVKKQLITPRGTILDLPLRSPFARRFIFPRATIASDRFKLVIAYQEFGSDNIFFAYGFRDRTTNSIRWNGDISAIGSTENSGVEMIYIK